MINNLRKWSRQLHWPQNLRFPWVVVALEGCGSGFNATNSIRTCLHFGANPPLFIGKSSFKDIQSLSVQDENVAKRIIHCVETVDEATLFSDFKSNNDNNIANAEAKSTTKQQRKIPRSIIAVENFVPGCLAVDGTEEQQQIDTQTETETDQQKNSASLKQIFQFPENSLIVMGHENKGVSKETLEKADAVVYIPQYGTISSINVVSCMGLMLFHYCCAQEEQTRNNNNKNSNNNLASQIIVTMRQQISKRVKVYQNFFREKLPMTEEGARVDPRPIHPSFFHQESDQIRSSIQKQISGVKQFRNGEDDVALLNTITNKKSNETMSLVGIEEFINARKSSELPSLELSVFFENFADQRNLGGLVRNANAFLSSVMYAGRKRMNKQGTVGSDNYTDIDFFGPMKDSQLLHLHKATTAMTTKSKSKKQKKSVGDEEIATTSTTPLIVEYDHSTIENIEKMCQRDDAVWWLLDCNQEKLFEETADAADDEEKKALMMSVEMKNYSSIVSTLKEIPLENHESLLSEVLNIRLKNHKRLILVVPPEAGLPCEWILNKCSARVTIFRRHQEVDDQRQGARGLPSQIASAIALHQLSPLCLF